MSYFTNIKIVDENGDYIDGLNPFSMNGDSIYSNDINIENSTKVGWTGEVTSLFDTLSTELYNDTITTPKVLYIAFNRTLYTNAIGIGCSTGKTFSNTKLEFIGSDLTVRATSDDSSNSIVYGTKLYSFAPVACIGIKFSFYTATTVGITNITIQKETSVSARIRALKPNNVITDIGATMGGNMKVALSDDYDFGIENTPMGEMRVVEPVRLVGAGFEGNTIDGKFWATGASGTAATIVQGGGQVVLTSGTSNGALVYGYTVRRARYVSGSAIRYRAVGQVSDTGVANNKRRWGVGWGASMPTITDGAWFQLDGTEFSVVTCKGGVETKVTTFNGYLGQYVPTTNAVTCEIYWTNSKVWFTVGGYVLHIVTAATTTWSNTLSLHSFTDSLNSAAIGASVTISVRTASIYRLGKFETQPIYYHLSGNAATHVLKLGAGILHKIIYNNTSGTDITIVDNITGTTPVMGIITTTSACLGVWDYNIPFNTGLILITTGNSLDATIVYE